ncbi:hypothetical protein P153DRAFT_202126 [Dothidotthia symphoricarpi CBS 119687]|uniref:Uncharacterized protein n=1 Tax=Dothidotthia symphoricarpi CBS 119687 TaxID=1392245 RepID=A0A6A6ALD8_9PLEO|nr:uncharacterized protein P153DRAFT_202126 [Dothidotthia symphoricarpi CBS 119687]KAF2131744.1 hypothetical protein P153DRAFT_202126 [Dothidotthia symphoricarpi CBS 119687]
MLEAQPVTRVQSQTTDEIPFGIRAIESGIEVDGVWISRTNTPVGSSRSSIMTESKLPRSFNNSRIELPQMSFQGSSRDSSRAPSSFDRAVSAERLPNDDSRSSSYGPVAGSSRQSASGNAPRNSTLQYHSGPPSPRHASHRASPSDSYKSSRRTSDESDYMAVQHDTLPYQTAYIRPATGSVPNDPRTDLDLLQTHRMSHVAETGQLTPRVRRPGNSGEWLGIADNQTSSLNGVNYFVPQKTPSPPLPTVIDPRDEEEAVASSAYTYVQDNHATNQARQARPLMESYAPKAAYYPDTYQPRFPQHQMSYDEVPYEVQTPQNAQRDPEVLRSVNSGFQVLRPGTFAPPVPTPEEEELTERRQSRKLQKKRRTSSESRKSAFVEQV